MAVSLKKGGVVSLSKESASLGIAKLSKVAVALGWDVSNTGTTMDLDAWALALTEDGAKRRNLVYFGNTCDTSRNIVHLGDNLTGVGDGDDETINMSLDLLPLEYKHILVGVTIYAGNRKRQSFKDVKNAFIRIYDKTTGIEICRYQDEFKDASLEKAVTMLFGILSRVGNEWTFTAIGRGDKFASITETVNVYSLPVVDMLIEQNKENNKTNLNGGNKVMAVSLKKGGKVSLAKVAADAGIQGGLKNVIVGLGWDTNRYDGGAQFDLDASAFMCGASGKVNDETGFIFYGNKTGVGIEHTGDNRTGEGDGDDEQIKLDLTAIPANVEKVAFTVTIDQADVRSQNFGMVENSYVRVVDEATGTELIRYDLGEDFSIETAIVVAEIYRHNGEWKFNAVGSGFSGGLAALCGNFGIDVE